MDTNSYEEIRTMHVTRLASLLTPANESSVKDICDKLDEKIDCYANGKLDHAVDAVSLLWKFSREFVRAAPDPPDPSPIHHVSSIIPLFLETEVASGPFAEPPTFQPSGVIGFKDRVDKIDAQWYTF